MPPRRDPNNNNNINDVMQQMRASQTQLVQMMTQFVAHQNAPPPAPVDRLTRFLKLKPSKFSTTSEPIVADDWLCSVHKDLVTCECTESEKVRSPLTYWKGQHHNGGRHMKSLTLWKHSPGMFSRRDS